MRYNNANRDYSSLKEWPEIIAIKINVIIKFAYRFHASTVVIHCRL